jgi:hypothetical protein
MAVMTVVNYCKLRDIPDSTLFDAISVGLVRTLPDGRIDSDELDAGWHAKYLARKAQALAGEADRLRQLSAAALAYTSEIQTLTRELQELRRLTAPQASVEPAQDRRSARLQAALEAFPLHHTGEVAEAVQRPPGAVYAVLVKFARLVQADIAVPGLRMAAE